MVVVVASAWVGLQNKYIRSQKILSFIILVSSPGSVDLPGPSPSGLCVDGEAECWLREDLLDRAVDTDLLLRQDAVGQLGSQAGVWRDHRGSRR